MTVRFETRADLAVVTLDRPDVRNAVDRETAEALVEAFERFDTDPELNVAILTGTGGCFCSGADLGALASGNPNRLDVDGDGPMGPTRRTLSKPVIAAIEGHAVAGGLELALWCDLRVAAEDATLGVFCRRWGVPLIDGGTVRLPRIVGLGRALDLVLTGRPVDAAEAKQIGLVDRVAPPGAALDVALDLAERIASFPQACMRADRESVFAAFDAPEPRALRDEFMRGTSVIDEAVRGAGRFAAGAGRGGSFDDG